MPPTANLLHVLGKHLSNASDCNVWIIAFNSGKTLAYAKTCFPAWRLLMLACFKKKKIMKGLLSVSGKNPSLFLYPYCTPPHPQAGDSNWTLSWAHLWSWKFLALKSPPWWPIKKSGFGGPAWNGRRCSLCFYTQMGQFWNSAVQSEEPLLKAMIFFLNYFFCCRDCPWRFIDLTSWLGLAKWRRLQLRLDRFCFNNKNNHNNIIHLWERKRQCHTYSVPVARSHLSMLAALKFHLSSLALWVRVGDGCSAALATHRQIEISPKTISEGVLCCNRKIYWFPLQCSILQGSSIPSHACFVFI